MKNWLAALASLLLIGSNAHAQTGSIKSAATLGTEINTFFLDNGTGQIVPFNARQALLDMVSSYSNKTDGAIGVPFTPTGGVTSTNVQAAIAELDTKKAAISSLANVALSGAGVDVVTTGTVWTPTLTFATPGDLAVTYATRFARYWQLSSNLLLVQFNIQTSAFTFTTASGALEITGLPFTTQNTVGLVPRGGMSFGGINKVGFSQIAPGIGVNSNILIFNSSGMGVATATVTAADMPTGGAVVLIGEVIIFL